MEIKALLSEKNYNRNDWLDRIHSKTGKIFFSAMAFDDESDESVPEVKGGIYARKK